MLWCATAFCKGQNQEDYQPDFQKIVYQKSVPNPIARAARKRGSSRFFGTFKIRGQNFAVHFYDISAIWRAEKYRIGGKYQRNSQLDVFALTNGEWRNLQKWSFSRVVTDPNNDQFTVQAKSLFLEPKQQRTPLVHLRLTRFNEVPFLGTRTDVFGVVQNRRNRGACLALDGNIPYSNTTVSYSEISYHDMSGRLTILATQSDPGETVYIAYDWQKEGWREVSNFRFDNNSDNVVRWDGRGFVRL